MVGRAETSILGIPFRSGQSQGAEGGMGAWGQQALLLWEFTPQIRAAKFDPLVPDSQSKALIGNHWNVAQPALGFRPDGSRYRRIT